MDQREAAYEILRRAILEIRAYAGPASQDVATIQRLATLVHNLPGEIRRAEEDGSGFGRVLDDMWRESARIPAVDDWSAREWLADRFAELGIRPSA